MMTPSAKAMEEMLGSFFDRCRAIERAGGVRHSDVVDSGRKEMPGYWYDAETMWWVPDCVALFPARPTRLIEE